MIWASDYDNIKKVTKINLKIIRIKKNVWEISWNKVDILHYGRIRMERNAGPSSIFYLCLVHRSWFNRIGRRLHGVYWVQKFGLRMCVCTLARWTLGSGIRVASCKLLRNDDVDSAGLTPFSRHCGAYADMLARLCLWRSILKPKYCEVVPKVWKESSKTV